MKKIILIFAIFIFQTVSSQVEERVAQKPDENIYNTAGVEVAPDYPGGINEFYKYIGSEYRVPNIKGLKGKVYVCFVVEKDGSLTDIKVIRDIGYGTGKEAQRVLENCKKWTPGLQDGKKVRVMYSLPISIVTN